MAFGISATTAFSALAPTVIGGLIGGSGGGSRPAGNTTVSNDPWSGVQPYLNGENGIFPLAQSQYQAGGWTPDMQANNDWAQAVNQTGATRTYGDAQSLVDATRAGTFNPNYQRVSDIAGAPMVGTSTINAQQVDPSQAFNSFGAADPTAALQNSLSGQVNNPYLTQMANALTAQSNQNLAQNVMPGIGQGANMAGQYGGSRQGIAQGVAAGNAQVGLDNAIAQMYGNAYGQAQNLMGNTANNMAGLGINNAQANVGHDLSAQTSNAANTLSASNANASNALNTQQFNANLALQNNIQDAANKAQQFNTYSNGLNVEQNAQNNAMNAFNTQQGLLGQGNAYDQANLNSYSSIVSPGAGMGGTTTTPYFNNQAANVLGGAAMGAGIFNNIDWGGNATAPAAATPPFNPYATNTFGQPSNTYQGVLGSYKLG